MKAQKDGKPQGSHNIDELFSSGLGKLTRQPSPAVWENITGQLPPPSSSSGGIAGSVNKWFFIGLAGVTITAAILFFQSRNSGTSRLTKAHALLPVSTDTIVSSVTDIPSSKNPGQTVISENHALHSAPEKPVQPGLLENMANPEQNTDQVITKEQIITLPENANQNTLSPESSSEFTITPQSPDVGISKTIMTPKTSDDGISSSTTTLETSDNGNRKSTAQISEIELNKPPGNNTPRLTSLLTPGTVPIKDTLLNSQLPPLSSTQNVTEKQLMAFSLELYTEPVLSNQMLKAKSSDASALLDYRKRNETSFIGIDWGLEGRISKKNLFVQTGIRYSVLGMNANYPFLSSLLDSSRSHFNINIRNTWEYSTYWVWTQKSGIIYYVPVLDSNLIQHYDSTWISLIDTSYNKWKEKSQLRYRYVEIPLLVGYQYGKGKLETEVSGGVALGFVSEMKGNIISTDLNAAIPANHQNIPFNKPLFSLLLRIGCSYHLNQNLSVFTRPAFRYTPRSAFGTGYPLYQRNYSLGVQFGIKLEF